MTIAILVQLLVFLVVLGLIWWLITTYLPLPQPVKMVVTIVFVLILCVALLQGVGVTNLGFGWPRR